MESVTNATLDRNLAYLDTELRLLWLRLDNLMQREDQGEPAPPSQEVQDETRKVEALLDSWSTEADAQPLTLRLRDLAKAFRLSDFERQLLLLAAAPDLEEAFGEKIAQAQRTRTSWPSVGLAWRLFCASPQECIASRDSFRDDAPLFRFRLLEMGILDAPLPGRILRADRRIVDALVGRMRPDARIAPHLRYFGPPESEAAASSESGLAIQLARRIREFLGNPPHGARQLAVNVFGAPLPDLEAFAAQTCSHARLPLLATAARNISASEIPLLMRESVLLSCALLVGDLDLQTPGEPEWMRWLATGPVVFIGSPHALRVPTGRASRIWIPLAVPRPDDSERMELWQRSLRHSSADLNGSLAAIAGNFELSATEIQQAAAQAANLAWLRSEPLQIGHIMTACRQEIHHHMRELAQKLSPLAGWDDLLLSDQALAKLHELCDQARCQHVVLARYGFGARLSRGRGVTALFAGPSGTGKTMAAEVVARDLHRDLFRIDLACVVSKYIGETEKNLRQAVAEAERARCVLLFDEADALFGRRSEVKDSHDRYANIEVSYLLQLMEETESAVVLLATNRRDAIDEAFLRRFRFLIEFPLPDAEVRRKLWARSFPPQVEIRDVHFDVLANRLQISGAAIKNIALAATYLAASDGGVVGSRQIAHATRRELERMGRPAPFCEADLTIPPDAKGVSR